MAKHSPYFATTSIPNDVFAKKYEITPGLYEDPNLVENYQKEALRYQGPDSVMFASDEPRRNNFSKEKIDLFSGGSRYSLEPNHRDVFLGETGKDARGINDAPDLKELVKQNQFRMRYQKNRFLNDASNGVAESGIPENKMMEMKKQTFYDTQNRLKIFEESRDGWIAGHNAKTTNESRVLLNEYEAENPDLVNSDLVLDNTGKRDVVSDFSLVTPVGYKAIPDNKYQIASLSYLYQPKNIKDSKLRKIFDQSVQDVKYTTYEDNQIPKSIVYLMDNIKKAREVRNDPTINDSMKESQEAKIRRINNKSIKGGSKLEKFEVDQKYSKLLGNVSTNAVFQNPTDYSENRKQTTNDIKKSREQFGEISKQQSIQDTNIRKLMNQTIRSSKEKNNNIESMVGKYVNPLFLEKMVSFRHEGLAVVDLNSIQRRSDNTQTGYNKKRKEGINNNVSKDQVNEGQKYYNFDDEYTNEVVPFDRRVPDTGLVVGLQENDYDIKDTTPINRRVNNKIGNRGQISNQLSEVEKPRDEITGWN